MFLIALVMLSVVVSSVAILATEIVMKLLYSNLWLSYDVHTVCRAVVYKPLFEYFNVLVDHLVDIHGTHLKSLEPHTSDQCTDPG